MQISQTLLYVIIAIWCLTILRSIIIMMGKKVFKDASINESNALFPLLNLFSMLEIVDVSGYLGILLFIPVVNLLVLFIMSYKLGKVYNCESGFIAGLIFLPIIFYPLLFNSTRKYKNGRNDTFLALDNAKDESINLLTESEIKAQNDSPYDLDPSVDSIFKSKLDTMEDAPTYKAVKIDQDVLDNLKNLGEEENPFEPIKRIESELSFNDEKEEVEEFVIDENVSNKFVDNSNKKDNMEFIDL